MILTITLNPAVDKTGVLERLTPGAVNRLSSVRQDPGGKGINVSKSLRTLGQESLALGILGGSTGAWVKDALEGLGIRTDFVLTDLPTRTNLKLVDIAAGETTDINEPGRPADEAALRAVGEKLGRLLGPDDIAVFSGSLPPGVPKSIYAEWTALCREAGAKAFVDADGESLRLAAGAVPYALKPNEHELSQLCGRPLKGVNELAAEGMRLLDTGVRLAAVSMGAEGALFLSEEACWRGYGLKVEARSTVGAGDAMMAALAYGVHAKLPLRETARLALALSAASVLQSGTQGADPAQVKELLGRVEIEKL